DPEGEQIAACIEFQSSDLLRRHVGASSHDLTGNALAVRRRVFSVSSARESNPLCQTEVQHFCIAIGSHHDVGRLEVAMEDARAVRRTKRLQNLLCDSDTLLGLGRTLEPIAEALALRSEEHTSELQSL